MNHVDCMNFKFNFLTILYIINLFLIAEEYKCIDVSDVSQATYNIRVRVLSGIQHGRLCCK